MQTSVRRPRTFRLPTRHSRGVQTVPKAYQRSPGLDDSGGRIGCVPVTMRPMTNWCPARCFTSRSDIRRNPNIYMTRTPGMEVICIIAPIVTKEAPTAYHVDARASSLEPTYRCTCSFSFQLYSHRARRRTLRTGIRLHKLQYRTLAWLKRTSVRRLRGPSRGRRGRIVVRI